MTPRRFLFALSLLFVPVLVGQPVPAHAERPVADAQPADSGGMTCSNAERLAGILETEAGTTPSGAHPLIAAIVVREAKSRHMDVCRLSETAFLATWRYAKQRPYSWHAARFAAPEAWSMALAKRALAGRLLDSRGAHHFDGLSHPDDLFVIGSTHFQP